MTDSSRFDRRRFLAASAVAAGLPAVANAPAALAKHDGPPNFLFIMADDLGWADLGCYGRDDVATPHLNKLARQGMRFTDAYANSSVCSPTRVGLITGRYQYRLPIGAEEPLGINSEHELPAGGPTMPGLLGKAGYQTSLVGKWHLGGIDKSGPLDHGYQHFWGIKTGGVDYFRHSFIINGEETPDLWDGDAQIEEIGYLTDLLGAHASEEITRMSAQDAPFLLSLHFTAPHWPWETAEDIEAAKQIRESLDFEGGSMATYRGMVESLDAAVGRVLAALKKAGKDKNTIVVFTSDNGGERFSKTWPLNGMKGELLEGGVRTPLIVRWPGKIKKASQTAQTAISMDWLPTMLAAAGADVEAPQFDGVDLLPVLTGGETFERKLFWRYQAHDQQAMRQGPWKYLSIGGHDYLFNIKEDPMERANKKTIEAERFARMKDEWAAWNETMLPYPEDNRSWSNKLGGFYADRY
ncbi:sulfatase-like hydrolase/transferase [Hyphococcus luteus]|uniref:Twin-arginine translocation pathway signal protein n=1 Tax=Hyphococcus luteus TaxID=2058213 RepID=A0A2S7K3F2_9PROT|nr:sulfatase-like hydrolase/transferase [Marinicaulis flavus]PQA87025.1 twin-arginine translocation pathway signal protein [Marinicaulis flavus]